MRIVSFAFIREYILIHPKADIALRDWHKKVQKSEWTCFQDIKHTFNSVDYVGKNRYVFNIKGNDYRLVAIIIFNSKKVYIRFIGTHKEYDKIDCSNI